VVIGVGVYDLLGAVAFPLAKTHEPTATSALPRLLMFLLTALSAAACAIGVAGKTEATGAPAPTLVKRD
jgi:hypothetical protein